MSDYKKLVAGEARAFYEAAIKEFDADAEEFGGQSKEPNLAKWIDRTGKLTERVEGLVAKWGHKEFLWVQNNTRNRQPHGGGDPRSNAFVSFLQDLRHEIKKLRKVDSRQSTVDSRQ
jgi:hypothetical protein